jgi:hypothetical protein
MPTSVAQKYGPEVYSHQSRKHSRPFKSRRNAVTETPTIWVRITCLLSADSGAKSTLQACLSISGPLAPVSAIGAAVLQPVATRGIHPGEETMAELLKQNG